MDNLDTALFEDSSARDWDAGLERTVRNLQVLHIETLLAVRNVQLRGEL